MQADHQNGSGALPLSSRSGVFGAKQRDQFVVDDLDDLLAGLNALDDFLAERLVLDPLDEVAGNLEIHIGLEQGDAHFAQGFADVALRKSCPARAGF